MIFSFLFTKSYANDDLVFDDNLKTILKRYDTYMETTKPVLEYYSKNINFHEIDGSLEIDQITNKIDTFLGV